MDPIISLLWLANMDQLILKDVYEGWDSMTESMNIIIVQNECPMYGTSTKILFTTIQDILITKKDKNCTLLHWLAHLLNPNFYNNDWLNGGASMQIPSSHGQRDFIGKDGSIYKDISK